MDSFFPDAGEACSVVAPVLIWNPASARGRGAVRAQRARLLLARRGIDVDPRPTARDGDAARLAEEAARSGAPLVMAIGGDGTHGQVADGILRSGARPDVAFLPGGTGNDLLAHFGTRALDDAVARVAAGTSRPIDVARASWPGGARHFLTLLGTGLAADTVRRAGHLRWLGRAAYVAAVPGALREMRAVPMRLELDGAEHRERFLLVAVCNTSLAGGGMRFAPGADPADGALEVVALRAASRARVLALLPRLLRGTHLGEPEVFSARASRIAIGTDEPVDAQADGEPLARTPLSVEVLPKALRVRL